MFEEIVEYAKNQSHFVAKTWEQFWKRFFNTPVSVPILSYISYVTMSALLQRFRLPAQTFTILTIYGSLLPLNDFVPNRRLWERR